MDPLHIYPQTDWHSDSFIVGTYDGLRALRDAIDAVLNRVPPFGADETIFDRTEVMVTDGEGYYVYVACVAPPQMDKMAVPYTTDIAKETREEVVWPETLVGREMHIEEDKP